MFNKQVPLVGPGGRATNDEKIIGEQAWRILKSYNFDPKELRGLGIQIQKLESSSDKPTEAGQGRLSFMRADGPATVKAGVPRLEVDQPSESPTKITLPDQHTKQDNSSKHHDPLDLPPFSQVDKAVFDSLPADIRKDLEDEYKRRSVSVEPRAHPFPPPIPRGRSVQPPLFPQRPGARTTNFKRIAQQLAPRSKAALTVKKNSRIPSLLHPSDDDLRRLDIDPEVYAALPKNVQREQLTRARLLKEWGHIPEHTGPRLILKAPVRKKYPVFIQPPPKARYYTSAALKQRGKAKGEKLFFTETSDVQGSIEAWVDAFRDFPPNAKDVEFFARFLVQCVDRERSSDMGVERAVAVVKWWLVLLRRYWGSLEFGRMTPSPSEEGVDRFVIVGEAWWKAFRDVKEQMDVVARKKYGGKLSIR